MSTCVCVDGFSPVGPFASEKDCNNTCKNGHCNDKILCSIGAYDINNKDFNSSAVRGENAGKCQCIDGEFVEPVNEGVPCDVVCSDSTEADDGLYHGINWRLKVGHTTGTVIPADESENFTVTVNKPVYFDFSEVRDCKGGLVHFAIKFDGKPTWAADAPDKWCCMDWDPDCTSTWGECCNSNGTGCRWYSVGLGKGPVPKCFDDSDLSDSPIFPIYVHTFTSESPLDNPEDVWVGISIKKDATCTVNCACDDNIQKVFQVRVDPPA